MLARVLAVAAVAGVVLYASIVAAASETRPAPAAPGPATRTGFTSVSVPRRVVYVIDASAAMAPIFDHVRAELKKSISGLKTAQPFNVVFFQDAKAIPLHNDGLLIATPDNKRSVEAFAKGVRAAGASDPLAALELAFEPRPDLIYFMAAGPFPDADAVIARVRELSRGGGTKIAAISIGAPNEKLAATLKRIADETDGTYSHVAPEQLKDSSTQPATRP